MCSVLYRTTDAHSHRGHISSRTCCCALYTTELSGHNRASSEWLSSREVYSLESICITCVHSNHLKQCQSKLMYGRDKLLCTCMCDIFYQPPSLRPGWSPESRSDSTVQATCFSASPWKATCRIWDKKHPQRTFRIACGLPRTRSKQLLTRR